MPHDSVGEFLETLRHCHPEILESQDDWASTFEKSNFIALCDLHLYRLSASIERHSNGSAAQQPEDDQGAAEIEAETGDQGAAAIEAETGDQGAAAIEAETGDQGAAAIEAETIAVSGDLEHFQRNMLIAHLMRLGLSLYWVSGEDKANAPMTRILDRSNKITLLDHFHEQLSYTRSAFSNQSIDSSLKVKVLLEHIKYAVYLINSNNPLHCRFSSKFVAYLLQFNITQNLWRECTSQVDLTQIVDLMQILDQASNLLSSTDTQSMLASYISLFENDKFSEDADDAFSQDEDDGLVGIYEAHQDNITFQRNQEKIRFQVIILNFGIRVKALVYALTGHFIEKSMEMSELDSCLIQFSHRYDLWITRWHQSVHTNLGLMQLISNDPSLRVERPLTLYCPVIYKALNITEDLPGFDYEILLNLAWTSRSFRQSIFSKEKNPFLIVQNMIDNHKDRFLNQLIATDSMDEWASIMSDQGQTYLRDPLFQEMQLYSFESPREVRFDRLSPLEHQMFQRYINLIDSCLPTFYVYQAINRSSATRLFQPLQSQWICKLNQFWMNPDVYLDDEIEAYLQIFESRLRDDHQQGIIEYFKLSLLEVLNGDHSESKTSGLLDRCVEFCDALDLGEDSIRASRLFLHQNHDQSSLRSPVGDAPSSPIAYSSLDSDQLRGAVPVPIAVPVPVPIAVPVPVPTNDTTSSRIHPAVFNTDPY